MQLPIIHADTGTPIKFIEKSNFDTWLSSQESFVKSYVEVTRSANSNIIVVPKQNVTGLELVVVTVAESTDMWNAGDLAKQLPKGQFTLDVNDDSLIGYALSFVLGAYQFSVYKSLPAIESKIAIADEKIFEKVKQQAEAIYLVRDLVNMPAADMMPQHLAETMEELAARFDGHFSQLIGDELLVCVNNLTIEDLIAIKLELSANHINNRLYGFDIWRNSGYIIKEALLKFAVSTTNSKKDAARFLGLTYLEFKRVLEKYKVKDYFIEDI